MVWPATTIPNDGVRLSDWRSIALCAAISFAGLVITLCVAASTNDATSVLSALAS